VLAQLCLAGRVQLRAVLDDLPYNVVTGIGATVIRPIKQLVAGHSCELGSVMGDDNPFRLFSAS